jgi:DNA-directed RNA polymerase specialized sigma24 family protein
LLREFDAWRLRANPALRARVEARAARPASGRLPALSSPTSSRNQMLAELMPKLLRFARHEVAVRQVRGDLEPGWLDPVELVEEAICQGLPSIPEHASAPVAARLLSHAMLAVLDAHVSEAATANLQDVSIDSEPPSPAPHLAASMQDDGIYDFWQPETNLLLEDLVADPDSIDPETNLQDLQVREALVHALFRLPDAPRRVFEQVVLDDWSEADVASVSVLREHEVRLCVEDCLNRLSSLLSIGARIPPVQVRALYAELGRTLDDERRARAAELVSYERDGV